MNAFVVMLFFTTSSGLCSFNWIQAGKKCPVSTELHTLNPGQIQTYRRVSLESFVFKMKRAHPISSWEFEDNRPALTRHKSPEEGIFSFCVYGQAAVMMRSGEACNLLGFHTNSIVGESRSWRKDPGVARCEPRRQTKVEGGRREEGWRMRWRRDTKRSVVEEEPLGQQRTSTSGFIVSRSVAGTPFSCNKSH